MRKRTTAILVGAAAVLGVLIAPAAAPAATVRMGSALTLAYEGGVCNVNCLSLQQAQVGGSLPNPVTSPVNGRVISWAVKTGDPNTLYTLRILRPVGLNTYRGAGSSPAPSQSPATVAPTGTILAYLASVPIRQGDSIGLWQTGAAVNGLPQNTTNGVTANVIANNFQGRPFDGAMASLIPDQQHELLLQATLRYCTVPKLTKKKVKKAKRLLRASDCTPKVKKKRSSKPRKTVFKQKPKPGATRDPEQPVKIVVSKGT